MSGDLGPTCATCLAFHLYPPSKSDLDVVGECRLHAPRPEVGLGNNGVPWPVVDGDDWCLQHRQSEAPFGLTFVPGDAP